MLDEVVAKLQRMELDLKKVTAPQASVKPGGFTVKEEMERTARIREGGCVCQRPLQLVMCGLCGETFPGRLRRVCGLHPRSHLSICRLHCFYTILSRASYLQDISACKGCKQNDCSKLLEFDLPKGMEQGLKKIAKKV